MTPQMTRRRVLALTGVAAVGSLAGCSGGTEATGWNLAEPLHLGRIQQYNAPGCGCCEKYASYLRDNVEGDVSDTVPDDITAVKREHGVPEDLEGCHTVVLDDYVVEGHVPVAAIAQLLEDRPAIDGITLPGMPSGSPGMGSDADELTVYEFGGDRDGDEFGTFYADP